MGWLMMSIQQLMLSPVPVPVGPHAPRNLSKPKPSAGRDNIEWSRLTHLDLDVGRNDVRSTSNVIRSETPLAFATGPLPLILASWRIQRQLDAR